MYLVNTYLTSIWTTFLFLIIKVVLLQIIMQINHVGLHDVLADLLFSAMGVSFF